MPMPTGSTPPPHRIDVHHHILPPKYVAEVGDLIGGPVLAGKIPDWSPSMSIDAMDRNGIATAVTSISAPGMWFGDSGQAQSLCRICNDYAADLREAHAGRFGVFASLPLPDVDNALAEIGYALDELKADGIGLLTSYGEQYPGDPAFEPVFDELNRRKAVVYFHPTNAACSQCLPDIPAATLDFPFDTTRAITSMLFNGTFRRYRDIRFIFSHAGGTVPFLAARIDRLAGRPGFDKHVPDGVLPELARLFYDTALSANEFTFASLMKIVAAEQVLFGTDFPFVPETAMTGTIRGLSSLGFDPGDLKLIERDNALRLFPQFGGA